MSECNQCSALIMSENKHTTSFLFHNFDDNETNIEWILSELAIGNMYQIENDNNKSTLSQATSLLEGNRHAVI